jgi:hypothetical protein
LVEEVQENMAALLITAYMPMAEPVAGLVGKIISQ